MKSGKFYEETKHPSPEKIREYVKKGLDELGRFSFLQNVKELTKQSP